MHSRQCIYCRISYYPDPRVRSRQKTCGKESCRKKMRRESQQRWRENNPGYWRIDQIKDEGTRQSVRKRRAEYMSEYRKIHPEYVKKDNERRRIAHHHAKQSESVTRRNQDERFVKLIEIKQLLFDLLPCRNKDSICAHLPSNTRIGGPVSNPLPAP
jgi:hypothetical protein